MTRPIRPAGLCLSLLLSWQVSVFAREYKLVFLSQWTRNTERTVTGATLAVEDFQELGYLTQHQFRVTLQSSPDTCAALRPDAVAHLMDMILDDDLDVILGPDCSELTSAITMSLKYWNIPVFPEGSTDNSLSNKAYYPNLIRVNPPYDKMAPAAVAVMRRFGWNRTVIYSQTYRTCKFGADSLYTKFNDVDILVAEFITDEYNPDVAWTVEQIDAKLEGFSQRARILWLCLSPRDLDTVMMRAQARGMTEGDYVFIRYEHMLLDDVQYRPWEYESSNIRPSQQQLAQKMRAYYTMKTMTMGKLEPDADELLMKASDRLQSDWNVDYTARYMDGMADVSALYLYDATYLYLLAFNKTLAEGGDPDDGSAIYRNSLYMEFKGKTGHIRMDSGADREPSCTLWFYGPAVEQMTPALSVYRYNITSDEMVIDEISDMSIYWHTANNHPPPDLPVCGFDNEKCPVDYTTRNIIIGSATGGSLLFIGLALMIFHLKRQARLEGELQQMLWRINYLEIEHSKVRTGSVAAISMKSMRSGDEGNSRRTSIHSLPNQIFTKVAQFRGATVAIRKVHKPMVNLTRQNLLEMKVLREMNHENINPFIGACVDPPNVCIVTNYCPKGNLQDIIENDEIALDFMFKCSLIMDIANGLQYIHSTPLHSHGHLRSSVCLIDSRWQIKITSFGLHFFKYGEHSPDSTNYQSYKKLLWTAPELLRLPEMQRPPQGTKAGDIYSFGIILQEILYRALPFFMDLLSPKEVLGRVMEFPGDTPYRPDKEAPSAPSDVDSGMLMLMKQCWSEKPETRPNLTEIKSRMKTINKGRKFNIMDNMIHKLEKYTTNLEGIVQQRTSQLTDEKKKTDRLLYRMLPEIVAEKLKVGQTVDPELYDAVTIYFSDICGFTALSSRSTPMQVVDLLNDLYTLFDDIIDRHDVYKVETIGDAYMCVSGLPKRNGDKHAGEIANMSLDLLSALFTKFRVRHLPDERLRLRSGFHTGHCASGVVGLTMPRYCLFGDTVNLANSMESHGMPQRVQVSSSAYAALQKLQGYHTTKRGVVEFKAHGPQTTYWLTGRKGFNETLPVPEE